MRSDGTLNLFHNIFVTDADFYVPINPFIDPGASNFIKGIMFVLLSFNNDFA